MILIRDWNVLLELFFNPSKFLNKFKIPENCEIFLNLELCYQEKISN